MKQVWQKLFLISLPLATLGIAPINTVKAQQVVPDNSLGAESSVVTPNVEIKGTPSDRIDGGATRGNNLFHSFQQFNVDAGRGVYFSNPAAIQNIFSRVTGSNPSNINGVLGVFNPNTNAIGNANLFLINPNGIIFGPNARLDVGGSFFASTANSLVFGNGFEFSTTNPQAPPLLTVNIPIGLRFRDNPGGITVRGNGQTLGLGGASSSFQNPTLAVEPGNILALVGGNVNLDGGVLQASSGLVELGGLAAAGTVGINSNGSLSFPTDVALADVSLTNQAGINVIANNAEGGGSININARNIGISGQSLLTAGITENLGTINNRAGDITLNATGETRIDQSRIENNVNLGTIADNRNIKIKTGSFVLNNGSVLDTSNLGSGDKFAGDVNVNASETLNIINSTISSRGRFGRLLIGQSDANNPSLIPSSILVDNSRLTTTNTGAELAGEININARDQISLKNSEISSQGRVGQIFIGQSNANESSVIPSRVYIDNSTLSTTNTGTTFAGDIKINARDLVSITSPDPFGFGDQYRTIQSQGNSGTISIGSETFSPKVVELKGVSLSTTNDRILNAGQDQIKAGDISIYAQDKIFLDQSFIETLSRRPGDAGNVTLKTNNGNIELAGNAGIFREKEAGSVIYSNIEAGGQGNAGTISITTGNLTLKQGSQLQSVSSGNSGNAGSINIQASGDVSFSGFSEVALATGELGFFPSSIFSRVTSGTSGNAGIIDIQAKNIFLSNGANLNTQNGNIGFAGDIVLNARDQISLNQSTIENNGRFGRISIGNETSPPKEVKIDLSTISATNESVAPATTNDPINAGDIFIYALDNISINQSSVEAFTRRLGNAGNVTLQAKNGDISTNGSIISTNVESGETSESRGIGSAGNINITARNLTLSNDTALLTGIRGVFTVTNDPFPGIGYAGNIIINTSEDVTFNKSSAFSVVERDAIGQGGKIDVTARSLFLSNGSELITSTAGVAGNDFRANAGNIQVNVSQSLSASGGSQLRSDTSGEGDAGNITIKAGSLSMNDNSQFASVTSSQGNAGKVSVQVDDSVTLTKSSLILSNVERGGLGIGGDINIKARSLTLTDGSQLTASVIRADENGQNGGKGKAGDIVVNATDFVNISGYSPELYSGLFASAGSGTINTEPQAAGNITVTTGDFRIEEGGLVNALTANSGRGGDVTINAKNFTATSGGRVLTTTSSNGDAGNTTLNISDSITLSGINPIDPNFSSGIFANTDSGSTGKGGNLTINTRDLRVEDGAKITVSSPESQAGNLNITAKTIRLNNGSITADTARPGQLGAANINLQGLDLLSLRNNSLISAKAINAANGGNINIDARNGFVVAFPGGDNGSDIIASASRGQGGNININTLRTFGLAPRQAIAGNRTNDIDASSEYGPSGTVNLNIINFNPIETLVELPVTVIDPADRIAQNPCQQGVGSEFIITGRGGLPVNPNQTLTSDNVRVDLGSPVSNNVTASKKAPLPSTTATVKQIVPAQGWVFNDKGKVVLTAYDPTNSGYQRNVQTPTSCAAR